MSNHQYFVSDLHLFAQRSHGHRHEDELFAAARRAERFVLGGDIFDFAWTTRRSLDESVEQATRWLEQMLDSAPNCELHYVLGNHDFYQPFIDRLAHLAARHAKFFWHPYYLRLEHRVFLHGDVADFRACPVSLARRRERCLKARMKPRVLHHLYELAIAARLHQFTGMMAHPRRRVAQRITSYLNLLGQGPASGTRQVYFGHTHRAMAGFSWGNLEFHNGGAPIRGLEFEILEIAA